MKCSAILTKRTHIDKKDSQHQVNSLHNFKIQIQTNPEYDQELPQSYTQTNPQHCEEETQNTRD